MFLWMLERKGVKEGGGEKERERSFGYVPYVPLPGIEPTT